jgi:hypothetical protein
VPLFFAALAGLKTLGPDWARPFKGFTIFLWLTFFTEVFAILWKWYLFETPWWSFGRTNLWVYNAFLAVRFCCMCFFYLHVLESSKIKRLMRMAIFPLALFGVLNFFFIEGPHAVNYLSVIPYHITFIFMALAYFRQLLADKKILPIKMQPTAWISLGTFIYYTGTLPFFITLEYLIKHNINLAVSMLYINNMLNVLMYSFYLTSFLCKPQSQK